MRTVSARSDNWEFEDPVEIQMPGQYQHKQHGRSYRKPQQQHKRWSARKRHKGRQCSQLGNIYQPARLKIQTHLCVLRRKVHSSRCVYSHARCPRNSCTARQPGNGRICVRSEFKRQLHGEDARRRRTVTTQLWPSCASGDVVLDGPRYGRSSILGSGLESGVRGDDDEYGLHLATSGP